MHGLQLEEYKDAFRIFDRSGLGSFTAEDIGWVMRSLGQSPTQQQIDAIIRDMDLDNDGVIDLAEFMIRMMALTTKAAPEEDLKHVFDVLDKSGEGMITADSLRSAIKNIAEWEMTDEDIEVAIKLADKSGDGRIDYDEFIAFVFGNDEPIQRSQHTGTNSVHPEPQAPQTQLAPSHTHAQGLQLSADGTQLPADHAQIPANHPQVSGGAFQLPTDAVQMPAKPSQVPGDSWYDGDPAPSTRQAPQYRHQLPFSASASQTDGPNLPLHQHSRTDHWVASQAEAMMQPTGVQPASQAGCVHENELYQAEASGRSQAEAGEQPWPIRHQHAGQPQDAPFDQPSDDVRLRVQSDDAEPGPSQLPASHVNSREDADFAAGQYPVCRLATQDGEHQTPTSAQMQSQWHDVDRAAGPFEIPFTVEFGGNAALLSSSSASAEGEQTGV
ncbi:MAG: calmodulin (ISS), partial [Trebouxia sp. A1-2]